MGSPLENKMYIQNTTRLLNRKNVKEGSQDLLKEVLWVSVGQTAACYKLLKLEVGKNSAAQLESNHIRHACYLGLSHRDWIILNV